MRTKVAESTYALLARHEDTIAELVKYAMENNEKIMIMIDGFNDSKTGNLVTITRCYEKKATKYREDELHYFKSGELEGRLFEDVYEWTSKEV